MTIKLIVNGQSRSVDVPQDIPLFVGHRDVLNLKGTKFGCGAGCAARARFISKEIRSFLPDAGCFSRK